MVQRNVPMPCTSIPIGFAVDLRRGYVASIVHNPPESLVTEELREIAAGKVVIVRNAIAIYNRCAEVPGPVLQVRRDSASVDLNVAECRLY